MREAFSNARLLSTLGVFLFISAVYLFAFPQPNVIYPAMVLLHVLAGVLATALLIPALGRAVRNVQVGDFFGRAALTAGAVVGMSLICSCTTRARWYWR